MQLSFELFMSHMLSLFQAQRKMSLISDHDTP